MRREFAPPGLALGFALRASHPPRMTARDRSRTPCSAFNAAPAPAATRDSSSRVERRPRRRGAGFSRRRRAAGDEILQRLLAGRVRCSRRRRASPCMHRARGRCEGLRRIVGGVASPAASAAAGGRRASPSSGAPAPRASLSRSTPGALLQLADSAFGERGEARGERARLQPGAGARARHRVGRARREHRALPAAVARPAADAGAADAGALPRSRRRSARSARSGGAPRRPSRPCAAGANRAAAVRPRRRVRPAARRSAQSKERREAA